MDKPIIDLHTVHTEWLNKLAFYSDEIKVMKGRLEEIASKNNGKEIMAEVEHFQNQLIVQKENIDQTHHDIKAHENVIEANIDKNPTASDHRKLKDHPEMRDAVNSFEKVFNELRHEFNAFLSKTM
ncbi:hypothetical protein BH09BAC5_BH09BAC5_28520 [soil metagenome]